MNSASANGSGTFNADKYIIPEGETILMVKKVTAVPVNKPQKIKIECVDKQGRNLFANYPLNITGAQTAFHILYTTGCNLFPETEINADGNEENVYDEKQLVGKYFECIIVHKEREGETADGRPLFPFVNIKRVIGHATGFDGADKLPEDSEDTSDPWA